MLILTSGLKMFLSMFYGHILWVVKIRYKKGHIFKGSWSELFKKMKKGRGGGGVGDGELEQCIMLAEVRQDQDM